MNPEKKRKCMKYSTVLGAMLLLLPNGVFWYWGNMSVYSKSYLVSVLHSTSNVDTPWVISLFVIFWTVGTVVSGSVAERIGRRGGIVVGVLLADLSVFAGYLANQHSALTLAFTMGAVLGAGTGVIDGSVLQLIVEWADDQDLGALTAAPYSSLAFGGVVINQIVTSYVNPQNLPTDLKLGLLDYFTQTAIVDKVPYMYLVVGGFSFGVHLIGFVMIRQKPKNCDILIEKPLDSEVEISPLKNTYNENANHQQDIQHLENGIPLENGVKEREINNASKNQIYGFTPKEMMKTLSFCILWVSFCIGNIPFILLTNYYKLYGQLYIDDDHFLTNIGSIFTFLNVFTSVLWGLAMDKFGVKNCLCVFFLIMITSTTWYFFTPMVNKWLYAVFTVLMGCMVGTIVSSLTAATVLLFGKAHFSTNFGVIMTSALMFNLVAPFLLRAILTRLGWFALFALGAGGNLLSLMLLLAFIPNV